MKKAKFIKKLPEDLWTGDARLYSCIPPHEFVGDDAKTQTTGYIVISIVDLSKSIDQQSYVVMSEELKERIRLTDMEAAVFPSDAEGEAELEFANCFRDKEMTHEKALKQMGYLVIDPTSQREGRQSDG